ncbi:MAG TPA: hypothetical protein VGI70_13635, partial [Polyangiales bacterium]
MALFARMVCLVSLVALAWSCNGDDCKLGRSECLSASLIRTCVPSSSGNAWLVSQCGAGETCGKPSDQSDASEGDAGTPSSNAQAACLGSCELGAHECVSDGLVRYCIGGGVWQLEPCALGQQCSQGACTYGGDSAVQLCQPGAKACASDTVSKVCDADGSSWIEMPCAANEVCSQDSCTADPKSSCDDADACLDNKTAIRCQGQAQGFTLQTCPGDTYCESGRCRGAVCAIGSMCNGSNQFRECVDGASFKDTQCGVNQVCQQDEDTAKCVPLACTPGTTACGDPRDPKVDAKKNFTSCVSGSGSGIPEWVAGTCAGSSTCDPTLTHSGAPCSQTCTKGAQRCATDADSGVNDGVEICGDDGTWGPIKNCNPSNDARLQ